MASFKEYPFAFIRGKIVPINRAQVSIMTNALHYGGGIFGGIKGYNIDGDFKVFRLDDHIARMQNSCKILRFPYEVDIAQIKKVIIELRQKNHPKSTTYIRPLIYRSDTNLSPSIDGEYDLAIYMLDMPAYFDSERGVSVCVSSWVRNSDNALPPRTKATGGYLNSALAIHDANSSGYDSAIMLDENGNVGEGAVMNLFIVRSGKLITPSLDSGILEGITRRTVIDIAREVDIDVVERTISRSELYVADEAFFSGTATNISWCRQIDDVQLDHGPITQKLEQLFLKLPSNHPELYEKL